MTEDYVCILFQTQHTLHVIVHSHTHRTSEPRWEHPSPQTCWSTGRVWHLKKNVMRKYTRREGQARALTNLSSLKLPKNNNGGSSLFTRILPACFDMTIKKWRGGSKNRNTISTVRIMVYILYRFNKPVLCLMYSIGRVQWNDARHYLTKIRFCSVFLIYIGVSFCLWVNKSLYIATLNSKICRWAQIARKSWISWPPCFPRHIQCISNQTCNILLEC